ncbi:MAG: class C sortase [[Clostridium] spiroforme]|uniref:Class C sortase n=1 Tax=Thomasclavelia spiroformis TaxID=29348 RepID=A0A943EQQ4_9FIRM|nr:MULTISPECIES: class C sortase [Thomasclavelia]MBS5588755.1 class C sortase [Thomasclavelia spiroformis]
MVRKILILLVGVGFLAGLGFFLFPYVNAWMANNDAKKEIENFEVLKEEKKYDIHDLLFDMMEDYNYKLYNNGQNDISDAWTFDQKDFVIGDYDFKNDVFATITIPKMNLEMPIYLGASKENMARGITVLANTSLPIGGKNTNSVLAGHRGYRGIPFFRDIENLQIGDEVIINNYWQELKYIVSDIQIILPSESEEVLIQDGKDMISLITCHPYRQNYQRYVVYCTREDDYKKNETSIVNQNSKVVKSSKNDIMFEQYLPFGLLLILIIFIFILIKKTKN